MPVALKSFDVPDAACRLWSLWDIMDRLKADGLAHSVSRIEFWICRCKRKLPSVTTDYDRILKYVNGAIATCRDTGLDEAVQQIQLLYNRLEVDVDRTNHDTISHMLRSVQQQLVLATRQQYFVRLNAQRARKYSQPLENNSAKRRPSSQRPQQQ